MADAALTNAPRGAEKTNAPRTEEKGAVIPAMDRERQAQKQRPVHPLIETLERLGGPDKTPMTPSTKPVNAAQLAISDVNGIANEIKGVVSDAKSLSERDLGYISKLLLENLPGDRARIAVEIAENNAWDAFVSQLKQKGGNNLGASFVLDLLNPKIKEEELVSKGLDWAIAAKNPEIAVEVLALKTKEQMDGLVKSIPDLKGKIERALEPAGEAKHLLVPLYMNGATADEVKWGFDGIGEAFRLVRGITSKDTRHNEEAIRLIDLVVADPNIEQALIKILDERSKPLSTQLDLGGGGNTIPPQFGYEFIPMKTGGAGYDVKGLLNHARANGDIAKIIQAMLNHDRALAAAKRIHNAITLATKNPNEREIAREMVLSAGTNASFQEAWSSYVNQYGKELSTQNIKSSEDLLKNLVELKLLTEKEKTDLMASEAAKKNQ